jgi:hypothetical protein
MTNIIEALVSRIDALEVRLAALEGPAPRMSRETFGAVLNKARKLPIFGHGRRPKFWTDDEVRDFMTAKHRRVELKVALKQCAEKFGAKRTPSRSAVARYWMKLDDLIRRAA